MEQLLIKMARQLESLDEASLLALWDKYAGIVSRFEPSKRWEEAALVLALIQAKHWKNQLFNHHWSTQSRPGAAGETPLPRFSLEKDDEGNRPRASVLQFRHKEDSQKANSPQKPNTAEETARPDGASDDASYSSPDRAPEGPVDPEGGQDKS